MTVKNTLLSCSIYSLSTKAFSRPSSTHNFRLLEIGKFETPKLQTNHYESGQFFLHKVFGFRGVVLFPWIARVYNRNVPSAITLNDQRKQEASTVTSRTVGGNEIKGVEQPYYQVLIDERDLPHVRLKSHGYTMLCRDESKSLIAIPGLESASHDDIIPYISSEEVPIQHEYLFRFFDSAKPEEKPFQPAKLLKTWQEKYSGWLELSNVHREWTQNVRVTVIPFYMGSKKSHSNEEFWWRYAIRLENFGDESVILRERHWKIFSNVGSLEQVHEKGVVGLEPELSKRQPAFQYSSHVMQRNPSGHMWGTYLMEKENGDTFKCHIPSFTLDSKPEEAVDPMSTLIDL